MTFWAKRTIQMKTIRYKPKWTSKDQGASNQQQRGMRAREETAECDEYRKSKRCGGIEVNYENKKATSCV